MGRVVEKVLIVNKEDEIKASVGAIPAGDVRRVEIEALVDTGANLMALPQEIADRLGLTVIRAARVRYGNGAIEQKNIAGPARVQILGRDDIFSVLVENRGTTPLIGQVVLEVLDLVVNPVSGKLMPNPESPDMPLVEQY